MKHKLIVALGSVVLAGSMQFAFAADAPAAKAPAKPAVAARQSMAVKGSYHTVHVKKAKLDCEDCHEKAALPDSTLNLRLHEPLAKGSPGPVNNDSCLDCHSKPGKSGKQTQWYAAKEK